MIAVIMSTYNGEKYLPQQLDSVLRQTLEDFILIIRDDGSSDGTVPLLRGHSGQKHHPDGKAERKADAQTPSARGIGLLFHHANSLSVRCFFVWPVAYHRPPPLASPCTGLSLFVSVCKK